MFSFSVKTRKFDKIMTITNVQVHKIIIQEVMEKFFKMTKREFRNLLYLNKCFA